MLIEKNNEDSFMIFIGEDLVFFSYDLCFVFYFVIFECIISDFVIDENIIVFGYFLLGSIVCVKYENFVLYIEVVVFICI